MPLQFDVQPLIDQIRATLLNAEVATLPKAEALALEYLDATKVRLENLTLALASKEITFDFFTERLKEEVPQLANELLSIGVLLQKASEDTINQIIADTTTFILNLIKENSD